MGNKNYYTDLLAELFIRMNGHPDVGIIASPLTREAKMQIAAKMPHKYINCGDYYIDEYGATNAKMKCHINFQPLPSDILSWLKDYDDAEFDEYADVDFDTRADVDGDVPSIE